MLVETYPESKNAVEALKRVAEIRYKEDNYEEAIASYYQIYELYPDNSYVSNALDEIEKIYSKKLKLYEKSIEVLILYANHYPDSEIAPQKLYRAAELYKDELKNKQAAIDLYHKIINKYPDSRSAVRAKIAIESLSKE